MSFVETTEQQALRKAVASMAANYGEKYYLEKARAGEHTTELWSEAGKLGFIGVNLPGRSTVAAARECTSCRWSWKRWPPTAAPCC